MPDISGLAPYLKFLHVVAMITAVTLVVGGDVYFLRVASGGHAVATARLGHAIRRRGPITGPIIEIGVVLGILTVLAGGFNFLAPWLIGAYIVVILLAILAFRYGAPAFTAILDAADTGDDTAVASLIAAGGYRRIAIVDALLFGVAIFLMVVKPLA